jgi:hypothetical protein
VRRRCSRLVDLCLGLRPALKAHRWDTCLVVALATGLVGFLSRATFVQLPFLQETVPVRLLVAVVAVVVAVTLLYPVFTELTPTLVRERTLQRVRPFGAVGLASVAYAPSAVGVSGTEVDTSFFLALLCTGLLAIVVTGHLAWAVVLALGFTMMLVDSAPGAPVATALGHLALGVWGGAVLIAVLVAGTRGAPRLSRASDA